MSGGVDSSVAAALLKRANFNVTGVFMKLYESSHFRESERRVRKIAKKLGIPFLVLDLRKEFKRKIINYFLKEYKRGRTPNPCVVCNKEIKFGLLLKKALGLDADFIATGHYARKCENTNKDLNCVKILRPACIAMRSITGRSQNSDTKIQNYTLVRAKDKEKDQSYFLWQLGQKQLKHILFPIGDYTKRQVRQMAKEFDLPVLEARESQEVCFIKKTTEEFLRKHLKTNPGPILEYYENCSRSIGEHQGLWFYTIGQRKGIGLAGGPYYVLDKDVKNNALIVTKNEKHLEKKELIVKDVNWISNYWSSTPIVGIKAKIRYRSPVIEVEAIKKIAGRRCKVIFAKPQRAVTPGQSVVFYKGEKLLGGGIIIC